MRVTDEQLDRLWRIRETLTDFADIAALELAISALSHASGQEVECTLGVGDGSGQLFVHGSYDAIKACQALILRGERDDWPKTVVVSSGDMCFTADWDGEYFVTRSPIKLDDAAIAAQRKEGE